MTIFSNFNQEPRQNNLDPSKKVFGSEWSLLCYTHSCFTHLTRSLPLQTQTVPKEFPRTNKNVLFSAQKSLCQLWRRRNFKTIQKISFQFIKFRTRRRETKKLQNSGNMMALQRVRVRTAGEKNKTKTSHHHHHHHHHYIIGDNNNDAAKQCAEKKCRQWKCVKESRLKVTIK